MNALQFIQHNIIDEIKEQEKYQNEQYGSTIVSIESVLSNDQPIDTNVVYLLGCNDIRGNYEDQELHEVPHTRRIREAFYKFFNWHSNTKVIDLGNLKNGLSPQDTYTALEQVYQELVLDQKDSKHMMVVFGGGADIIKGAFNAYTKQKEKVDIVAINSLLPILPNAKIASKSYVLDMLIEENSCLHHYAHVGYQSYLNSIELLNNLDKFSFQNVRLGQARENIDKLEPLFRKSGLVSFDLVALAPTAYPMFHDSPAGLNAEEACRLMQFAGMATRSNLVHIAGYDARKDIYNYYAMSIAQMIWYAIEGFTRYENDVEPSENKDLFETFDIQFSEYTIRFLKSKLSHRWWILGANKEFIPCDYYEYEQAQAHNISDKWLQSINR